MGVTKTYKANRKLPGISRFIFEAHLPTPIIYPGQAFDSSSRELCIFELFRSFVLSNEENYVDSSAVDEAKKKREIEDKNEFLFSFFFFRSKNFVTSSNIDTVITRFPTRLTFRFRTI